MPTSSEHAARQAGLAAALSARGLDAALLLHAVDVYWLTGTRQNAALWLPARGAPVLLVRKSLVRARAEAAVDDVRPFPPSKELAAALPAARVGLTLDAVPAATVAWWGKQLPGAALEDVSAELRALRSVKSPAEVAIMREGARRLGGVLRQVPEFLRPGLTELEVAAELERRLRLAGHEGSPRMRAFNAELFGGLLVAGADAAGPGFFDGPVVGQGLHAAYPIGASRRPIRPGEPVICDYTTVCGGYVVDMTRTAACGPVAPEVERALDASRRIQEAVAALLRPGTPCTAPWERALQLAGEAGLAGVFMGPPGDQARFVGHGVGLELDELPVLAPGVKAVLQAGQTIAVEPKFVLPGVGAVGVENTFVVTERGGERLDDLSDELLRC
jgi:Xaa-Pro aminopeptidase